MVVYKSYFKYELYGSSFFPLVTVDQNVHILKMTSLAKLNHKSFDIYIEIAEFDLKMYLIQNMNTEFQLS